MKIKNTREQSGFVLASLIIVLPFLIIIVASYMNLAISSFNVVRKDQLRTQAQFGTDAGADYGIQTLNADPDWTGTAAPIEIHNDGVVRVTYEVLVINNSATSKTLSVSGKAYSPITHTNPDAHVDIKVDLRPITTGNYSLVTGVGGLFMSNSAKIIGGGVFVNGEIQMQNSSQIGLTTNSVDVEVAHQNCPNPPDATYPRICNSGENGQPISFQNTAHIYGSVKANNQTSGANMSNLGLVAGSGVSAKALPPHDRAGQKAAVSTNLTGSAASCSGSQARTWAANTKITGDVSIKNNCVVTVLGDVWITGKLETGNSTRLVVANSVGTTKPNIMIDGGGGAKFSNSTKLVSNTNGTGFQIIAYWSTASCSPDCTTITGLDLYNSRNHTTISLDNSAEGPQTIFYSRWTRVQVVNSGQIGALVGQTVELKNSSTITFGTSVEGVGETFWVIDGYRRTFN